jgi:hypothetical protein
MLKRRIEPSSNAPLHATLRATYATLRSPPRDYPQIASISTSICKNAIYKSGTPFALLKQ